MATTITPTTLTYSVSEIITLDGVNFNSITSNTITGVSNYVNNIFSVGTGSQNILVFNRSGVAHRNTEYDIDKIKYLRLTNADDTNSVTLSLNYLVSGSQEVVIDAGGSFVLTNFFGSVGTADNLSTIEITTSADVDIPYAIGLIA